MGGIRIARVTDAPAARRSRVNAMQAQLARSVAEFEAAVGGPSDPRREELRTALQLDFAFIAAYWVVYAATSGLLAARDFSAAVWLGVIAGECATVAALLDVAENLQTLRLLRSGPSDDASSVVRMMRTASLAKWFFAFTTTGLLSVLFLQQGSWWHRLIGSSYALAAAGGIATLVSELASTGRRVDQARPHNALRAAFLLMALSLAIGLPFAAALA
jgi:hypothetical protein